MAQDNANSDIIFLDHQATTPIDQRVVDAMLPYLTTHYGNCHSKHVLGQVTHRACEVARGQVAALLNAQPDEVIFTSGATESNNLAIKGFAEAQQHLGRHIITCQTEHKAVLDSCAYLETKGFAVTYLPVDASGLVSLTDLAASVRTGAEGTVDRTILMTFMGANNEIGTLHPLAEIAAIAKEHRIALHVDGAQFAGKLPTDLSQLGVDMLSLSGHKMYDPKGIGALYLRKKRWWQLEPQIHGGGQEFGMRSGTVPVALVVALGEAARLCYELMEEENQRLIRLRERLWHGLQNRVPGVRLNGHPSQRLPGNLNVTFSGIESEFLSLAFKRIAVSSSSACSAGAQKASHVLRAIGRTDEEAMTSVRFGIGRHNTAEEVDVVIDAVAKTYARFARGSVGAAAAIKSASSLRP